MILSCLVFSEICGSEVCLFNNFEKSPFLLQIFLLLLFSSFFWYFNDIDVTPFEIVSVLGGFAWIFFFISFIFFALQIRKLVLLHLQAYCFFPQACLGFQWTHQRHFFIFITVFLPSSIHFWIFLRVFISLHTLPICSCMLSSFFIGVLHIVIIVILSSLSSNSNICVIPECNLTFCFLLILCVFPI